MNLSAAMNRGSPSSRRRSCSLEMKGRTTARRQEGCLQLKQSGFCIRSSCGITTPSALGRGLRGRIPKSLGVADKVVQELNKLLEGLGEKFRRDLGLVCESHHLENLNDLDKYKPSQPFGSGPQETANLQYCAILLRTADLLHVTNDRTPSVSFRTISPSDPKS